jgi:hypothetical protein
MPSPTGSATGLRPAADFPGVIFPRRCCHAKHARSGSMPWRKVANPVVKKGMSHVTKYYKTF